MFLFLKWAFPSLRSGQAATGFRPGNPDRYAPSVSLTHKTRNRLFTVFLTSSEPLEWHHRQLIVIRKTNILLVRLGSINLTMCKVDKNNNKSEKTMKKLILSVVVLGFFLIFGCELSSPPSEDGNIKPVAEAGSNQIQAIGNLVQLDGSSSNDSNSDSLSYSWLITSTPNGSTVNLSDANIVNPTFTPDIGGDYQIQLIVNDGTENSNADIVEISAVGYWASDYNNFTEGFGIKYNVTDQYGSLDCNVWAISQMVTNSTLVNDKGYEYITSITKNGTTGEYFNNSTLGGKLKNIDGKNYYTFFSGMNVGNQAHFYRNCIIPEGFNMGDSYSIEYSGTYSIEDAGSVTIGSATFNNCIKINISSDITGEDYTNGDGYYILSPGVGIVKIEFIRSNSGESYANTTVTYEYLEETTFSSNSFSGTITTDGTTPSEGAFIQIATGILDESAQCNSSGDFMLGNIYGPDVRFFIGYNGNDSNDNYLDFDYPENGYPLEYVINDITGDMTTISIDLSTL